jgi:hypothetical protein
MCKLIFLCFNVFGPNRDETVAVGAPLYELDTEAEASVATSAATPPPKAAEPPKKVAPAPVAPAVKALPPAMKQPSSHRAPSIKFLGKEGWSLLLSGPKTAAPIVYVIPPNYGRPPFSEEEMEALLMGGANLTPDVKKHSDGAMFG